MRLLITAALAVLLALGGASAWASDQLPSKGSMALLQADFSLNAQGPWEPVKLPDTWAHRGIQPHQTGRYRLYFSLGEQPAQALAARIDRLSRVHEVRINGHILQGNLDAPASVLRRPVPTLLVLPPALLRAGSNQVDVVVEAGARAGLSPVIIGPQEAVDDGFLWSLHRHSSLPQFVNAAAAGLALFLLVLWWRRRGDGALGTFSALSLLVSLRNMSYFSSAPIVPTALTDTLFFGLQSTTVALLGFFALHHAGGGPTWMRRLLWGVLLGYPLLGAGAVLAGQIHQARGLAYPGLMIVAGGALATILKTTLARRTGMDLLLLGCLVLVFGAGVHDYLYQQGHTSVMDSFWLPYATPLALLAFALGQLRHLVQALHASEEMAQLLELRVAERTAQLQASNEARLRQLTAASHDLRQPLVSIGLLGELLNAQLLPAPARRTLARMQQAVTHMDDLFGRLLEFSRLEAGTVTPRLQAIPVQALFDVLAVHSEEPARAKGLRLRVRPTQAVVMADRLLLEQILHNLVSNALRYTPSGAVLVAARPASPDRWRIEVRDSGIGIAPADQQRIFDEFLSLPHPGSLPAADAGHPGLGLGLAIVDRQARLLGTRVGLRSAPGRGSRFWVELPCAGAGAEGA